MIVLVGPLPPPVTGQAVVFGAAVAHLTARPGARVDVISINATGRSTPARIALALAALARIAWAFAGAAPRVVYVTVARSLPGSIPDVLLLALARLRGTPVVIHVLGRNFASFIDRLPGPLPGIYRALYRGVARALIAGPFMHAEVAAVVPPERVATLANFVDDEIAKSPLPAPRAGPLRLAFMANVLPSKGLFVVLDAVALLARDGIDAHLDFIGAVLPEGAESAAAIRARLDAALAAPALAGRVTEHGVLTGAAKIRVLSAAAIFAMPTTYIEEAQPVALLEAMALGCAPVASRTGGIPEVIDDGATGVLLAEPTAAELARAVAALARDPARLAALGAAACEKARRAFSLVRYLTELEGHLSSVMSGGAEAASGGAASR